MFRAFLSFIVFFALPICAFSWGYIQWLSPQLEAYEASLKTPVINAYRIAREKNPNTDEIIQAELIPEKPLQLKSTLTGKIAEVRLEENTFIEEAPEALFKLDTHQQQLEAQLNEESSVVKESTKNTFYIQQPGRLSKVFVKPKTSIQTNDLVAELTPFYTYKVKATVTSAQLTQLAVNQTLVFTVNPKSPSPKQITATITQINGPNKTLFFTLDATNQQMDLKPDSLFETTLPATEKELIVKVPKKALIEEDNQLVVYTLKKQMDSGLFKIQLQPISLKQALPQGWVEVTGLAPDTLIVSDLENQKMLPLRNQAYRIQYDLRYLDTSTKSWF